MAIGYYSLDIIWTYEIGDGAYYKWKGSLASLISAQPNANVIGGWRTH